MLRTLSTRTNLAYWTGAAGDAAGARDRLSGRIGTRSGSGLGLSIVASVAKAHGGRAEARARPDGGLDVQVTLPATAS